MNIPLAFRILTVYISLVSIVSATPLPPPDLAALVVSPLTPRGFLGVKLPTLKSLPAQKSPPVQEGRCAKPKQKWGEVESQRESLSLKVSSFHYSHETPSVVVVPRTLMSDISPTGTDQKYRNWPLEVRDCFNLLMTEQSTEGKTRNMEDFLLLQWSFLWDKQFSDTDLLIEHADAIRDVKRIYQNFAYDNPRVAKFDTSILAGEMAKHDNAVLVQLQRTWKTLVSPGRWTRLNPESPPSKERVARLTKSMALICMDTVARCIEQIHHRPVNGDQVIRSCTAVHSSVTAFIHDHRSHGDHSEEMGSLEKEANTLGEAIGAWVKLAVQSKDIPSLPKGFYS